MDPTNRAAVATAWQDSGLAQGYPTPQALEQAIDQETDRIEDLIWHTHQTIFSQELRAYKGLHGDHPPYLEEVAMRNRAMLTAREAILTQELEAFEPQEQAMSQGPSSDPDRWKNDPESVTRRGIEWISDLTDEIWPDRTSRFQMLAFCLMQTRWEDGQPIPESKDDPLVPRFTALVEPEEAKDLAGPA